jgi:hypothetical protein
VRGFPAACSSSASRWKGVAEIAQLALRIQPDSGLRIVVHNEHGRSRFVARRNQQITLDLQVRSSLQANLVLQETLTVLCLEHLDRRPLNYRWPRAESFVPETEDLLATLLPLFWRPHRTTVIKQ